MKTNIFALLLMIVSFAVSGYGYNCQRVNLLTSVRQKNEPVISKEGGFSVIFPAGFDEKKFKFLKGSRGSGASQTDVYHYAFFTDRGRFTIAYNDLPEMEMQGKDVSKILEDAVTRILKDTILDKEATIKVDGYQGKSLYLHYQEDGETIYQRLDFFLAGQRMYNYLYSSRDKAELLKPEVKRFFSSFHKL